MGNFNCRRWELLIVVDHLRDFTLFSLIYALGLRISEALGIRLEDINWSNEMLIIHGKGRKIRSIPMTTKVQKMLRKWVNCRKSLLNARSSPFLFLSKRGTQLSIRMAEQSFKEIVENVGPFSLKKVTPHSLRHAFASHAVDGNADLLVLKTILGHSSIKTTEIYLHPSIDTLKKAVNNHLANDVIKEIRSKRVGIFRIHKFKYRSG